MKRIVRILHLDDVEEESGLVKQIIRKSGLANEWKWVSNKNEYLDALRQFNPDVVLSDHSMPGFSSVEAFKFLKESGLDVPFILVTATVSEEFAASMMREGVADYILKDRPQRLPAAVENAVHKWEAEKRNKDFINQIIRSQANLNAIMEHSSVNIYSLDRSFRYITFNSSLKDTLKMYYGLDIKVGDSVLDFLRKLDPTRVDEFTEMYVEALQGVSVHSTKEFNIYDNRAFISFRINPIYEGDMISGVVCFASDITKEKLAEENIARSEARFRALIDNNFDAIVLQDENRKMLYASPSTERMLGYTNDELINNLGGDTGLHPDDIPFVVGLYEQVMANPGVPFSSTVRVMHKDNYYIWVEALVTNMLENQNVRSIVSNFHDVTGKKEAELQQAQMTRDIVQRNKDLEQFAYIVSHNLRGPVANILGIANVLKYEGLGAHEKAEAIKGIFTATARLDEVIVDLNHILETKQEVNDKKEKVYFQELVDNISLSINSTMVKNNVKVITDFRQADSISTIRSFLQSIFYNLISNSVKYRRPDVDPEIRIKSSRCEDRVRLVFSDNGIGIDLDRHGQKVFGLYKRFHPMQAEGKGMGLFMVKTQVETLGGEISVQSEVNKGTEFIIEL